jgi:dolichol-phosphate mannosyltransferase
LLSWGATFLARIFFPDIADSGSGFFAFRKEVIKNAPLKPQGFRMLFEILGKGNWKTAKEIPYTFGLRNQGTSKLSSKTVVAYLLQLWGLFTYSLENKTSHGHAELVRVLKFMGVGITGIFVNLSTMGLLTWQGLYYPLSALIGIETSILTNFVLNDALTFSDLSPKLSKGHRLKLYHMISITGIILTFGVTVGLTEIYGIHYLISALVGIFAAFVWNFSANRGVTWK